MLCLRLQESILKTTSLKVLVWLGIWQAIQVAHHDRRQLIPVTNLPNVVSNERGAFTAGFSTSMIKMSICNQPALLSVLLFKPGQSRNSWERRIPTFATWSLGRLRQPNRIVPFQDQPVFAIKNRHIFSLLLAILASHTDRFVLGQPLL